MEALQKQLAAKSPVCNFLKSESQAARYGYFLVWMDVFNIHNEIHALTLLLNFLLKQIVWRSERGYLKTREGSGP